MERNILEIDRKSRKIINLIKIIKNICIMGSLNAGLTGTPMLHTSCASAIKCYENMH